MKFRAHKRLISLLKRPFLRRGLRNAVREIQGDEPIRLVVGANGVFERGWIATDRESLNLLDPRDWDATFGSRLVSAILAEHVWEHLSYDEARYAASICWRFLKPGGYLRVAVPDGLHPSPAYIDWVNVNGIGPAAWDHKVLYNYRRLANLFEEAGFHVSLLEYWDEAGTFHHVDWDPGDGLINRSRRFHRPRRQQPFTYTSLIIDAHKPVAPPVARAIAR